eukprot:12905342-Prorocentrum_lima.AAC.1
MLIAFCERNWHEVGSAGCGSRPSSKLMSIVSGSFVQHGCEQFLVSPGIVDVLCFTAPPTCLVVPACSDGVEF